MPHISRGPRGPWSLPKGTQEQIECGQADPCWLGQMIIRRCVPRLQKIDARLRSSVDFCVDEAFPVCVFHAEG